MAHTGVKRRRYESPVRAAAARETRARIRAAAAEMFTRDGFTATTMTAVAAAAGVSERTVYLAFPTKAALLNECIRVAVRGGDEDVPMLERATWQAALHAPGERMLALIADASTELMGRAARLLAVGESIGATDPLLDAFRERGHSATRADLLEVAKALKRANVLRRGMPADRAADIMYAIAASESVYLRLVDQLGWSEEEYARAIEDALRGLLVN